MGFCSTKTTLPIPVMTEHFTIQTVKGHWCSAFLLLRNGGPRIQVGYEAKKAAAAGVNPWALYHQCEQQPCHFGEEVTSESVYLNFVGGTTEAYQHYTELVATQNNAQKTEQIFSGWSVSTTQEKLNADSILEQTNRLAKSPLFSTKLPERYPLYSIGIRLAIATRRLYPQC